MTDSTTAARRVAALALIPTSVAVFGAGLAWANAHDPSAPSSSSADQSPDPRLAAAQAKVDEARARLAMLQAQLAARLDETVPPSAEASPSAASPSTASPSAAADASAVPKSAAPTLAPSKAPVTTAPAKVATVARTTAVPTTAPPPPPVQTTTRASKKA